MYFQANDNARSLHRANAYFKGQLLKNKSSLWKSSEFLYDKDFEQKMNEYWEQIIIDLNNSEIEFLIWNQEAKSNIHKFN